MKRKRVHAHHRKSFKWWLRNNFVFLAIIAILCIIVGLIIGYQMYNFERVRSMEALLDKDAETIHWRTGLSDEDVEKLRETYPDFDWENTWDRKRWLGSKRPEKPE